MRLLSKLYLILLPVVMISMAILIFNDIKDFNNRVEKFQKDYLNKSIEEALNLKNSPLFSSYFDNLEYDLQEESLIIKKEIKTLFIKKIEINNKYSKSIKLISFLSKDKKNIVSSSEFNLEKVIDQYLKNKDIHKRLFTDVNNEYQVIIIPLSINQNNKEIKTEHIRGYLLFTNKLYVQDIKKLKEDILISLIVKNIFILLSFCLLIYLISKNIANPIKELTKEVNNLSFAKYKKITTISNIKEISFLANTISKISYDVIKKQNHIQNLNHTLEDKVRLRTEELEESTYELEESLENLKKTQTMLIESEKIASLGTLVAGVAHEINTPVGIGVTGITHLKKISNEVNIKYKNENLSEDEFIEYLNTSIEVIDLININLNKTAHLVKSFKQVAVDQTSEELREFNLKGYINEVLFSLNSIIKKKDIDVIILCEDNINLNSYPGAYSQIITNLILNSTNHGFKKEDTGKITIECKVEKEFIHILYKDNGMGISEENISKIFNPFFTTNRQNGGTGLGLNILHNIVTNTFYGSIKCTSEVNKGVLFELILKKDF